MTPTPQSAQFITANDAASLRAFVKAAEVALASAPPAPIQERRTIQELGTEFLVSKARGGKSPRYLLSVRSDLSKVFRGQMLREAHTITTAELEAWTSGDWTPRYRRNLITTLRTVFNFAKLRGYVGSNPAQAIELPHADDKPVEIQTPDQVRVVLHTAQRLDAGVARLLAVEYFGGLRSAEAMRLAESEIGPRYVEVKTEKCKTRRRRLVTISATLRAWLDWTAGQGAALPLRDVWARLVRVKKAVRTVGVPFPANAARTALEAGHSEAMLFAHYRELVTPEAAAAFWAIAPLGAVEPGDAATVLPLRNIIPLIQAAPAVAAPDFTGESTA